MKLQLDENTRRFLPLEIELNGKTYNFKYLEPTTKDENEFKEVQKTGTLEQVEKANEELFWKNFTGDENAIVLLKEFLEEKANVNTFIRTCNINLGKQQIYI